MISNRPRWARWSNKAIILLALPAFTAASPARVPGPFDSHALPGLRDTKLLTLVNGWHPTTSHEGIAVRVHEDVLEIEPVHGSARPTFNGLQSARKFDFTAMEWHVRADLSRLNLQTGIETKFRVTRDHQNNYVSAEPSEERYLHFLHKAAGVLRQDSIPYDPLAHAWLRIRHDPSDDTIRWETSPDGRIWTERWRDERRFDMRSVFAELYAGSFRSIENPGFVRFTDFGGGISHAGN